MTCLLCKGEMKPSTTIHTVQLKNCVVVIKNVPCLKCEQCGEVVLSADTVEKIEHILQTVEKAVAEIRCELPGLCSVTARRGCQSADKAAARKFANKQQEKPTGAR